MNYFLSYNNLTPLFIGGIAHGKRDRFIPKEAHWQSVAHMHRLGLPRFRDNMEMDHIQVDNYRVDWWELDGVPFRVFIHQPLDRKSAMMILFGNAERVAELEKRVQELERENDFLKKQADYLWGKI